MITIAELNVLPKVNSQIQVYFSIILDDDTLNAGVITSMDVLYGNVVITNTSMIIPKDNLPVAIGVTATFNGDTYYSILYYKAVYVNNFPNNIQRLTQKFPHGVFTDFSINSIIGQIIVAISKMVDNYYVDYFKAQDTVYVTNYSQQLEYELNGTAGLLSSSTYPDQILQLLASLDTVYLNSYDLELFFSKYIYYRTGLSCAVYINDHVDVYNNYWELDIVGRSELDQTTILAPQAYVPAVKNLDWIIYNSASFSDDLKEEITNLIIRISRADIGNKVTFNPIVDPVNDDFTLFGPTYPLDPRLIYDKCLQYIGDDQFPLNIIGYKKII